MVGVPLAGTLADDCITTIVGQQILMSHELMA
jgi:hypothetical protein